MDNLDLHSLRVLDEIYKTGSLSKTADRLGLTQPAISLTLGRLRKHFDDQLFVRIGNAMQPTPQAEGLINTARVAIEALSAALHYRSTFDPGTTDRIFKVAVTDVGQIVLLPRLLKEFAAIAPNVRVDFNNISDRTPQMLETGELDLAVGFIPQIPSTLFQQLLFNERFACLSRSDHPRIRDGLTLDQFEQESHVLVYTNGTGHSIIDREIESQNIRRRIAVVVPNFLGVGNIVGDGDHICTLPRLPALIMARRGHVAVWEPPFNSPTFAVKQHWHERQARDLGNRWLRGVMSNLFLTT
jgi:DNA-binding transcriptional LysR family regulator